MSGRHAEISRRFENGEHCWYLKDLQSTNGTFVRASTIILNHEQEFLIGSGRFRFEVPHGRRNQRRRSNPRCNATRKWESLAGSRAVMPDCSRCSSTFLPGVPGGASRFASRNTGWAAIRPSARSSSMTRWSISRHARVYRDEKNRWIIANARSRNGLWARIQEVESRAWRVLSVRRTAVFLQGALTSSDRLEFDEAGPLISSAADRPLLGTFSGCIRGHSLHHAGVHVVHRVDSPIMSAVCSFFL